MDKKVKIGVQLVDAETGIPVGLVDISTFQTVFLQGGGGGNAQGCDCEPPKVKDETLQFNKKS